MNRPQPIACATFGLLLFWMSAWAVAQETMAPWVSYKDFVEKTYLDRYLAIPWGQRDRLDVFVHLDADPLTHLRPSFAIEADGKLQPLGIDGTGRLNLPLDATLLQKNPMLYRSGAKETPLKLSLQVLPKVPDTNELTYHDLMRVLQQANDGLKSAAGMMRFLVPTMHTLELDFPAHSDATLTIGSGGEVVVLHATRDGKMLIHFDAATDARNPMVHLSERPLSADLPE